LPSPISPAASAARLAKRVLSAAFLSGVSSFSLSAAAFLENRSSNAAFSFVAARLAKRASSASFLFGDSAFSLISAARLDNRFSSAACLLGLEGFLFFCSASGRFGSRSITVISFPSRSMACNTDSRGKSNFNIL